jgi:hypothetical protein
MTIKSIIEPVIRAEPNRIDWKFATKYGKFSDEFLDEFSDRVDWIYISSHYDLSIDFITKFKNHIKWFALSQNKCLTYDHIKHFYKKLNWRYLSMNSSIQFTEEFLSQYIKYIDWPSFSMCCGAIQLSNHFIDNNIEKFDWSAISAFLNLSMDQVKRYENYVSWDLIFSCNHNITFAFLREFSHKMNDWISFFGDHVLSKNEIDFIQNKNDDMSIGDKLVYDTKVYDQARIKSAVKLINRNYKYKKD